MAQERWNGERGDVMSRRTLIKTMGVAGGAAVAGAARRPRAGARGGPAAPPSTITSPPRDFGPGGAPTTYFTDPDVLTVEPVVQRPAAAQCADPAPVDRRAVVGGPGVERPGPLSRVERHPEQPPAALARGRRPRQRVPQPVEQQQRQHVRLPGPPALLRAPDPARGPLRARRLGDGHRATPSTASGSTRPTTSCPIPTAATGSPIRRTAGSSTRARPTRRAGRATRRAGSIRGSASRPEIGRLQARAADQRVPRRPERPRRPRRGRGPGARSERPRVLARLQEALRRQHRPRPGRHGAGRQGRDVRLRRRRRQQALQQEALHRLHDRRREVRARRRALRRRRQPVVLEQRRPQRGLQRRDGLDTRRASSSGASGCPRSAATSASAGPSATACSWRPASRSTPSTSRPRAPRPARATIRAHLLRWRPRQPAQRSRKYASLGGLRSPPRSWTLLIALAGLLRLLAAGATGSTWSSASRAATSLARRSPGYLPLRSTVTVATAQLRRACRFADPVHERVQTGAVFPSTSTEPSGGIEPDVRVGRGQRHERQPYVGDGGGRATMTEHRIRGRVGHVRLRASAETATRVGSRRPEWWRPAYWSRCRWL